MNVNASADWRCAERACCAKIIAWPLFILRKYLFAVLAIALLWYPVAAVADVLILKDGSRIQGKVQFWAAGESVNRRLLEARLVAKGGGIRVVTK